MTKQQIMKMISFDKATNTIKFSIKDKSVKLDISGIEIKGINASDLKSKAYINNSKQEANTINNSHQKSAQIIENHNQKAKRVINNGFQKSDIDIDNQYQDAGNYVYNLGQKSEKEIFNSEQIANRIRNSHQSALILIENDFQKSKIKINNEYQKANIDILNQNQKGGNINNSFQEAKGNINNSFQETKGNITNNKQKTDGNIFNLTKARWDGIWYEAIELDGIYSVIIKDKRKNGIGTFKDHHKKYVATNGIIHYHSYISHKDAKQGLKEKKQKMLNGICNWVKSLKGNSILTDEIFHNATGACYPGIKQWKEKVGIKDKDKITFKKFKELATKNPTTETNLVMNSLKLIEGDE